MAAVGTESQPLAILTREELVLVTGYKLKSAQW
jgi:Domain of unknown function (DUF4224)